MASDFETASPEARARTLDATGITKRYGAVLNGPEAVYTGLSAAPASSIAPESSPDLAESIRGIWHRVLGNKGVGARARLFDLPVGVGRVDRLLSEIEKETGVRLPITVVFQAPTLEELTEVVRRRQWPTFSPQVLIKPGSGGPPLFILSGLGGSVFQLLELARSLRYAGAIYVNQQQGLDGVAPPHRTIDAMADFQFDAVRAVQPAGPYCLLGYSLGGTVALETARRLMAIGEPVEFLGLIEPGLPEALWPWRVRLKFLMSRMRHHCAVLRGKPRAEFLGYVGGHLTPLLGRLGRLLGMHAGGYSPYRAVGLPTALGALRDANIEAIYAYRPQPFSGRVMLFRSEIGDPLSADSLSVWPRFVHDITAKTVQGGHETILRGRYVRVLADAISAVLP